MDNFKVKRYSFDEIEYELVCEALRAKIEKCVREKNTCAEQNYRTLLADLEEEPWQEMDL